MLHHPIEIVGGGLAGLSLGLALRREGVEVTISDAGTYPRHRVCGEFIAGLRPSTIARLGLAPFLADGLRHRDVAWFSGSRTQPVLQSLPSAAIGLSRYTLDARLASAFSEAGGHLHTNTRLTDVTPAPGRVIATGRRRAKASEWMGLKVHVRGLGLSAGLEVHLGDDTYVGLAPVEEGRTNVCGLFRRQTLSAKGPNLLLAYLDACGLRRLAARLATSEILADSFSAVAALDFDGAVPAASGVHLGDACAMIPPFTGNGMAMAFQSAESALDPLLSYAHGKLSWPDATSAVQTALRRRFRLRLSTARALHPFMLSPARQRWLTRLHRAHLLPLRPMYALLH